MQKKKNLHNWVLLINNEAHCEVMIWLMSGHGHWYTTSLHQSGLLKDIIAKMRPFLTYFYSRTKSGEHIAPRKGNWSDRATNCKCTHNHLLLLSLLSKSDARLKICSFFFSLKRDEEQVLVTLEKKKHTLHSNPFAFCRFCFWVSCYGSAKVLLGFRKGCVWVPWGFCVCGTCSCSSAKQFNSVPS